MDDIALREKNKYQRLRDQQIYSNNNKGLDHIQTWQRLSDAQVGESVIDLGCGNGRAVHALENLGFAAAGADLVQPRDVDFTFFQCPLWDLPSNQQWNHVFSTDVMEHLPTAYIDQVIDEIARICQTSVYLAICTRPDNLGQRIGEVLHLTVQPGAWWQQKLERRFHSLWSETTGHTWCWFGRPLQIKQSVNEQSEIN